MVIREGSGDIETSSYTGCSLQLKKNCQSPSLNRFAKSLLRQAKKLFVLIEQEGVEPTNNQAERDLRRSGSEEKSVMEPKVIDETVL